MKSKMKEGIMSRYRMIFIFIALFALAISGMLLKTTVYDVGEWNKKADSTLLQTVALKPERGNIMAADGSLLAVNVRYYEVRMDFKSSTFREKEFKDSLQHLCDSLPRLFHGTTSDGWKSAFEEELAKPKGERRRDFLIAKQLTRAELARLRTFPYYNTKKGWGTVSRVLRTTREKPYGKMAYRSIGNLVETKDGWHGSSGLEKALDSLLFGKPGSGKKVQLANGMRNWATVAPQNGYDIRTTIDVRIQDIVEAELYEMCFRAQPEWATAVLMDVQTGDIKAISNLAWNESRQDYVESVNYAIQRWELGSVMKPISLMIALEDGIKKPFDRIPVGVSLAYAGAIPITDTHKVGANPTVVDILAGSSNIGTAKIIISKFDRTPWGFRKRLEDIGFFEPLNVGLAGETQPKLQDLGSPDKKFRNEWRVNLSRSCYGYAVEMSPLQNLGIINAIANDGKFVRPRLVSEIWQDDSLVRRIPESYVRERICSPEVAKDMRMMLKEVVWSTKKGLPTAPRLQNNFVTMAGKTGTARVHEAGKGYTSRLRLTFTGFFPYKEPRYSCIVVFNDSKKMRGAQWCSGEVAMKVALKMYARGMLGNKSDYRNEADNDDTPPTVMSMSGPRADRLVSDLGLKSPRRYKSGAVSDGTVPSVIGMGLREAVATLERSGLNVTEVTGSGYVAAQTPKEGTPLHKGGKVTLNLTNR